MMGGALGGIEAIFLPNEGLGFWPLVSMARYSEARWRSPLTGIIFALEAYTRRERAAPAAGGQRHCAWLHGIGTEAVDPDEKVARRGYHLSREYAVDPLEILFVRDAMRTNLAALPSESTPEQIQITA